ncbi:MAG TPA: CAP domain-containing protein [Pirellulales bacterium]|jgi:uncharacterized protein YkwD|nr:CAP domain-containing protein [Pirellulales bacterium]
MFGYLATLCAWGISLLQPQVTAPVSPPDLHPIEARIIERTNSQRTHHGLPPLVVDVRLQQSARRHAAWMTNSRSMTHTNQAVGENIAMGQHSSTEVLNAWMNSSGHRANILNPGYKRIGVAAYKTPDGTIFWCQQFLQ